MVHLKKSPIAKRFDAFENRTCGYCFGGLFSGPPDPPDYTPYAAASAENAALAAEISREQLDWSRQQWAEQYALLASISDVQIPIMQAQAEAAMQGMEAYTGFLNAQQQILHENHRNAMQDRSRYERMYQPIEDDLIIEAMAYDTPQRRALEAGRAQADVARSQEAQRKQALMELEGYGIDPSQTRRQALDASLRTGEAAAQAAAGNAARQRVEDVGRSLRAGAIDVGRGYPSQVAGAYGQAIQSGQVGGNLAFAPSQAFNQSAAGLGNLSSAWQGAGRAMGTPAQWGGLATSGYGTAGNILNQGYGNELAAYQASMQYSPWNLAAGIGGGILGWQLGGPMGAMAGMNMGRMYAKGGTVEGPDIDADVMPYTVEGARESGAAVLTPGEHIIPKDVVEYKGTEFFDRLIAKSKEKIQEREADKMRPQQVVPQTAGGGPVTQYMQDGGGVNDPLKGYKRTPGMSYYEWRRRLPAGSTTGMSAKEAEAFTRETNPSYFPAPAPPKSLAQQQAEHTAQKAWQKDLRKRRAEGVKNVLSAIPQGYDLNRSHFDAIRQRHNQQYGGALPPPSTTQEAPTETPAQTYWSGRNPRPMFGYESDLALQGLQQERQRLAYRNAILAELQANARTQPWQYIEPNWQPTQLAPISYDLAAEIDAARARRAAQQAASQEAVVTEPEADFDRNAYEQFLDYMKRYNRSSYYDDLRKSFL